MLWYNFCAAFFQTDFQYDGLEAWNLAKQTKHDIQNLKCHETTQESAIFDDNKSEKILDDSSIWLKHL